ncbi:MAG: (deoxy)nucleoside triphosphate pyrophosphohydrolase [Rothia sp. (in: high G+C Gram-positive bacteria)]|nr:(deoxy)nucleoside triphosphate pyrophosphohydrolase [Rothia sp. (in: high G+C Gram-positive bacteria)]
MADTYRHEEQFLTQVVGAALVDRLDKPARLLLAQRSSPPALAGLWEFPGGKVEPGESCQQALRREIQEELGVSVCLGQEIKGPYRQGWKLSQDLAMRVFWAEITQGSPRILADHSQLVWRSIEAGLLDVAWIPADYPIVQAVIQQVTKPYEVSITT